MREATSISAASVGSSEDWADAAAESKDGIADSGRPLAPCSSANSSRTAAALGEGVEAEDGEGVPSVAFLSLDEKVAPVSAAPNAPCSACAPMGTPKKVSVVRS